MPSVYAKGLKWAYKVIEVDTNNHSSELAKRRDWLLKIESNVKLLKM